MSQEGNVAKTCLYKISRTRTCSRQINKPNSLNYCEEHYKRFLKFSEPDNKVQDDNEVTMLDDELPSISDSADETKDEEKHQYFEKLFTFIVPAGPNVFDDTEDEDLEDGSAKKITKTAPSPSSRSKTPLSELEKYLKTKKRLSVDAKEFAKKVFALKIDEFNRNKILSKLDSFSNNDTYSSSSSEGPKLREYLNTVTQLPWQHKKEIFYSNEFDKVNDFLQKTRLKLDESIYGMDDVKDEILNFITLKITDSSTPSALALCGPPGTGKTSICLALKNILSLPFETINLGGQSSSSFLLGHSFTYVTSRPGQIVASLVRPKEVASNMIMYFDELDKCGEDIYEVLIHLTDKSNQSAFRDNYLGDLEIDLSHIFFIFSFNDESKIDPILLDRLKVIHIDSPSREEKIEISKQFLIPRSMSKFSFPLDFVVIPDDSINFLLDLVETNEKEGLRSVAAIINEIFYRLNTLRYTDWNQAQSLKIVRYSLLDKNNHMTLLKRSGTIYLDRDNIESLLKTYLNSVLKRNKNDKAAWKHIYC